MGAVFSRFRKRQTTIEILKDLDTKIQDIEKYGQNTEQRLKKIVGTLIYSVILYITVAFIFYFYFFPASLYDQIFYITPLLIFPILILFTKKMISWYYKRKISRNHEKLKIMQKEKKKILDEVMETETYKKAQEILLKFAPDQLRTMTPLIPQPVSTLKGSPNPMDTTRRANLSSMSGELRQRGFNAAHRSEALSGSTQITPTSGSGISSPSSSTLQLGNKPMDTLPLGARSPLPRPILSQQRNYLDRLVDYLVGDGPSNRYALICRQCHSHNGMALKEEFEYFEYRCCYCNFWNPARKQKPSAPKLEDWHEDSVTPTGSGTSSVNPLKQGLNVDSTEQTIKPLDLETSSPSDTDSDIEVVEKPSEVSEDQESIEQCSNGEDKAVTEEDEASNSKPSQTTDKEEYEEEMEVDEYSSSRK